ncbi:MAG: lysine--tRNA ligase, partial [Gemmatimonadales bacterium]
MSDERSFVEAARRRNLEALAALGVRAFGYGFTRSHTAIEATALYDDTMGDDGPEVTVAGRLVALRSQGKTTFGHLEDVSGRVQFYARQDQLGAGYDLVKLLDLG